MTYSKIFFYLALSFVLGIVVASFLPRNLIASDFFVRNSLIILFVIFSFVLFFWKEEKTRITGIACVFLILGILRFVISLPRTPKESEIYFYNDKEEITFTGIVTKDPDIRIDKTNLIISARKLKSENEEKRVSGKVLVSVEKYPEYQYGDELEISGKLKTPIVFEDFNYKEFLDKDDIYSVCYKPEIRLVSSDNGNFIYRNLFNFKNKLKKIIARILPEPESSFLSALLLGIKGSIPKDILDNFSKTGTSHIIAISGLHITILLGVISYLLSSVSRKNSFWIILGFIICFVIISGAKSSVIRASFLGSMALFGKLTGRIPRFRNILIGIACIILLASPKLLRYDIGFQLSFLAVVGIVYIMPLLKDKLEKIPSLFGIKDLILVTVSAQITTTPIIMYNLHNISLVAPLVNLFILPILPIVMILGLLALSTGLIFLPLAQILGWGVLVLLRYIISTVNYCGNLDFAALEIKNIWWGWIVAYYLILMVYFYYSSYANKKRS